MIRKLAMCVSLICALGIGTDSLTAATKAKTVPATITTQNGKTYNSALFVSSTPDGLVIQYRPEGGGIGVAKLKFRDLPQELRNEFNYNESAAVEYEASIREAAIQRQELAAKEAAAQRQQPQAVQPEPAQTAPSFAYPVGRFRAAGTIRGALIVDSITGETWHVDMHSVLEDFKDNRAFYEPKVLLP